MVGGVHREEVIELIRGRVAAGKSCRNDRKLALVVEGGAMRGTYTAGSLLGLHLIGAVDVFDGVYATSAGAINAAHFLSGVGHLKAATYYKALADGRFFNMLRLPRPADIDFVFDVVLRQEIPLEMDLLAQSNTIFKVSMINYDDGKAEMKIVSGTGSQAWDTLKAAIAMPVVYNRTIRLPGGRYVDGGMAIPYPLLQAIGDGMTDLVVLLSRDPSQEAQPRGLFQYLLWSLVFAKDRAKLICLLEDWHIRAREVDRIVTGHAPAPTPVRILCVAPTNPRIKSSTQNQRILREGCIAMTKEMLDLFECSHASLARLISQGLL